MACLNTCCKHFHKSSSVTVSGSNLVIAFTDNPTSITNEERFCFMICQDVPAAGDAMAVQLTVNGSGVQLWDRFGNPVPGCGLKKGILYKGYYGTGTTNHVISASLPYGCAKVSYPCSIAST